jgi:hypothetical protein
VAGRPAPCWVRRRIGLRLFSPVVVGGLRRAALNAWESAIVLSSVGRRPPRPAPSRRPDLAGIHHGRCSGRRQEAQRTMGRETRVAWPLRVFKCFGIAAVMRPSRRPANTPTLGFESGPRPDTAVRNRGGEITIRSWTRQRFVWPH